MKQTENKRGSAFWAFVDNLYLELWAALLFCLGNLVEIMRYVLVRTPLARFAVMPYVFTVCYAILLISPYAIGLFLVIRRFVKRTFLQTLLCYRLLKSARRLPRTALFALCPAVLALVLWLFRRAFYLNGLDGLIYALFIVSLLVLLGLIDQLGRVSGAVGAVARGGAPNAADLSRGGRYPETGIVIEALLGLRRGLDTAHDEQLRAERFKTELLANVSHDIKTPLTSIVNYTDLIKKRDIPDETLREYVEVLDRNAQRLKILTNDLLEASKTSTGNVSIQPQPLELVELISQAYGGFDSQFAAKGLTFLFRFGDREHMVLADGSGLWRVMENLFANAVKYSAPNTRVYADVATQGGRVFLTMKNISSAELGISAEELMERFVRGDRSRHTEGSGLGLFIAQNLMALMQGELSLSVNGDLFEARLALPAAGDN